MCKWLVLSVGASQDDDYDDDIRVGPVIFEWINICPIKPDPFPISIRRIHVKRLSLSLHVPGINIQNIEERNNIALVK